MAGLILSSVSGTVSGRIYTDCTWSSDFPIFSNVNNEMLPFEASLHVSFRGVLQGVLWNNIITSSSFHVAGKPLIELLGL